MKKHIFYWVIIGALMFSCVSLIISWNSMRNSFNSVKRSFYKVVAVNERLRESYPTSWVSTEDHDHLMQELSSHYAGILREQQAYIKELKGRIKE